jgi:galactokinase
VSTALAASVSQWRQALTEPGSSLSGHLHVIYGEHGDAWRQRYLRILDDFEATFGAQEGPVVISRCPGQMNIMGMHIDYGGMPSLRLAVKGHDTVTVVRQRDDDVARLHSRYEGPEGDRDFDPAEFSVRELASPDPLGDSRQALMEYAGQICTERERQTGSTIDDSWSILPQGQLVYLDSWLRGRDRTLTGLDAHVYSNVSPSGGMSSSSALVISTAYAALGMYGVVPGQDMTWEDAIDGVGTSEWIRGTRGGTADHGGMVLGLAGELVSVGVFPAQPCGNAPLPPEFVAVIFDSGVPRVYDEAGKEETVLAYPLGTFVVRDLLLPKRVGQLGWEGLRCDFHDRIELIRDITPENLGITSAQLSELLLEVPQKTSLSQVESWAAEEGQATAFSEMVAQDVGAKFPRITADVDIYLRRRFLFGLAEQDRVAATVDYLAAGDLPTVFELVRLSHEGDYDEEVEDAELEQIAQRAAAGDPRGRLAFVPGGYGRMTPAYDQFVVALNDFLSSYGQDAGAIQRLGAGWGGNVGGLISRRFLAGDERQALERLLRDDLGVHVDLDSCVATPGQGAGLLPAPA